jgi:chromosome partitioning protein
MVAKKARTQEPKIVVLGGSKGGVGRSSCARNLLIAAAQSGLDVAGIDTDQQNTFSKWRERRVRAKQKLTQILVPEVTPLLVTDTAGINVAIDGHDLVIVDTQPSIEEDMQAMIALCRRAALVLVPTSPTHDDLESVAPWLVTLKSEGCSTAFVLNKANRRTRSFEMARSKLVRHGRLCPVEVPMLEDMHMPHQNGLAAVDFEKNKAGLVMQDLWAFVRTEINL